MGCRWGATPSIRPAWSPAGRSRRPEGPRLGGPRTGVSSGVIPLGQRARRDELPATEVAARDAAADTGKDLVVDRPTCGREIVGGLHRARLGADEHDLVAFPRAFDLGDVQHHEVHADAAGEADALSAYEDPAALSGDPREPIAVTDGDRRDPAVARKTVFVAVRDAGTLWHARDAVDPRVPGKRGPEGERRRQMRRGMDSVDRQPRAHGVHSFDRPERGDAGARYRVHEPRAISDRAKDLLKF